MDQHPPGDYNLRLTYSAEEDPQDFEERIFTFTLQTPCELSNLSLKPELLDAVTDYTLGEPTYSKTFSTIDALITDNPIDCGQAVFEFML